ncbi:phage protein [Streptococcus phage 10750.4]|nr:phage protein [Streptococcus pyogenes MGAS10750]
MIIVYHNWRVRMLPEQIKSKLERIKHLDIEIKGLYYELQYIDDSLFQKSTLTPSKVKTSQDNGIEKHLLNQLELKDKITESIHKLIQERLKITELINLLDAPLERTVLRMYYVNHLEVWKIAEQLSKGEATVYRKLREAIKHLSEVVQ